MLHKMIYFLLKSLDTLLYEMVLFYVISLLCFVTNLTLFLHSEIGGGVRNKIKRCQDKIIDKIQTGDSELTKASRVQNCVHSNSFINDDIFVEKSQKSQSVHTFKPAKYLFTDTWVHYEDLHFCKVSKPLEFITFQLMIHCF